MIPSSLLMFWCMSRRSRMGLLGEVVDSFTARSRRHSSKIAHSEVLTSMMQTYYRVLGMPITPDVAQKITDGDIGIIWTATKGFWFESTMLQAQRMRATPVQSEQFTVEPSLDLICHIHSLVYFRQPLLHHHILQTLCVSVSFSGSRCRCLCSVLLCFHAIALAIDRR